MHARVTKFIIPPGGLEQTTTVINDMVIPTARDIAGFKGGFWFADRETGDGYGITLWASEADLKASEDAVAGIRMSAAQRAGTTFLVVESFEVIAQA